MTKRNVLAVIILAFAGFAAGAWFLQYRSAEQSRSEELVRDVLRVMQAVAEIRSQAGAEGFEGAYKFEQIVSDAQRQNRPWLSEDRADRRAIVESVQDMLSDLEAASRLYLSLHKAADKERLAQFTVKLDAARLKTIDVAATVLDQKNLLNLSSKRHIVDYIDENFAKDLAELQATKDDPSKGIAPEIVAVFLIRHEYEK